MCFERGRGVIESFDARKNVLIVDDVLSSASLLYEIIKNDYNVQIALDARKALELINDLPPDLILLDIRMPGMDGYQLCQELKRNNRTKQIPVIFVTALSEEEHETRGLEFGGNDYISKPINPSITKARIKHQLELNEAQLYLNDQRAFLEKTVQERTRELVMTQEVTIQCMASLAETRDNETGNHILRTRKYVRLLATYLKDRGNSYADFLNDRTVDLLYQSAGLHDIGKVGIPDSILLKPARLTREEFEIMKTHTILGGKALDAAEKSLGTNSFLRFAKEIAYSHHENWDGSGYPYKKCGREIPLSGRLMALADVYDALISKRVYKPPFPHEEAVEIIKKDSGKKFDPVIVECFLDIHDDFRRTALDEVDDEEQRTILLGVS
jgi:putative two-component system response regulator